MSAHSKKTFYLKSQHSLLNSNAQTLVKELEKSLLSPMDCPHSNDSIAGNVTKDCVSNNHF